MNPNEIEQEIEANEFAMCLLMPENFLRRDIGDAPLDLIDDKRIKELAKRYQVSPQLMTLRLCKLGYFGR